MNMVSPAEEKVVEVAEVESVASIWMKKNLKLNIKTEKKENQKELQTSRILYQSRREIGVA